MIRALDKLVAPLRRRVMLMVGRAVVRLVADGLKLQELQLTLLAGETLDGVERLQEYGLSSHPHPGAEAAVVFVGGSRNHGLVIAVDDRRYRLKSLQPGEVALYDDQGQVVHLKRQGIAIESHAEIALKAPRIALEAPEVSIDCEGLAVAASGQVQLDTPQTAMSGDASVGKDLTVEEDASVGGTSFGSFRTIYNSHTHEQSDQVTPSAPTEPPVPQLGAGP